MSGLIRPMNYQFKKKSKCREESRLSNKNNLKHFSLEAIDK